MSEEVYDPWLLGIQKVLKSFLGLESLSVARLTGRHQNAFNNAFLLLEKSRSCVVVGYVM
jgi:hypothetical protein